MRSSTRSSKTCVKSLDKFKVPAQEKGELLAALGGMKPDILNQ